MNPIGTKAFYGSKADEDKPRSKVCWVKTHRTMPSRILGPTQYWQEFYKQADALATATERSTKTDTLCTFVYQQASDGSRRFVVAHPEVYWWYYKARAQEERCSYEVRIVQSHKLARTLFRFVDNKRFNGNLDWMKGCAERFWIIPSNEQGNFSSSIFSMSRGHKLINLAFIT